MKEFICWLEDAEEQDGRTIPAATGQDAALEFTRDLHWDEGDDLERYVNVREPAGEMTRYRVTGVLMVEWTATAVEEEAI